MAPKTQTKTHICREERRELREEREEQVCRVRARLDNHEQQLETLDSARPKISCLKSGLS